MLQLLKFLKKVGFNIDNFLSFISDCKYIVCGTYACMTMVAIIVDIIFNGGSNIWPIAKSFILMTAVLY